MIIHYLSITKIQYGTFPRGIHTLPTTNPTTVRFHLDHSVDYLSRRFHMFYTHILSKLAEIRRVYEVLDHTRNQICVDISPVRLCIRKLLVVQDSITVRTYTIHERPERLPEVYFRNNFHVTM